MEMLAAQARLVKCEPCTGVGTTGRKTNRASIQGQQEAEQGCWSALLELSPAGEQGGGQDEPRGPAVQQGQGGASGTGVSWGPLTTSPELLSHQSKGESQPCLQLRKPQLQSPWSGYFPTPWASSHRMAGQKKVSTEEGAAFLHWSAMQGGSHNAWLDTCVAL